MELKGCINELGEAVLPVTVKGLRTEARIQAVLDTGFSGELCLPVDVAIQLGLELCGVEMYELADGTLQRAQVFRAEVDWFGEEREVEVILTDSSQALIGTGLLAGKKVELDFAQRTCKVSS